eukprot:3775362-Rhodomonas_salina.2
MAQQARLWRGAARAALTAASKTSVSPCCVSAEHSTYATAFTLRATASASADDTRSPASSPAFPAA